MLIHVAINQLGVCLQTKNNSGMTFEVQNVSFSLKKASHVLLLSLYEGIEVWILPC